MVDSRRRKPADAPVDRRLPPAARMSCCRACSRRAARYRGLSGEHAARPRPPCSTVRLHARYDSRRSCRFPRSSLSRRRPVGRRAGPAVRHAAVRVRRGDDRRADRRPGGVRRGALRPEGELEPGDSRSRAAARRAGRRGERRRNPAGDRRGVQAGLSTSRRRSSTRPTSSTARRSTWSSSWTFR